MTKKRRIEELENEKAHLERKISSLEKALSNWEAKFDEINTTMHSTPENCKPGPWCSACKFGRMFVRSSYYGHDFEKLFLCNRAGACSEFIQKEVKEKER